MTLERVSQVFYFVEETDPDPGVLARAVKMARRHDAPLDLVGTVSPGPLHDVLVRLPFGPDQLVAELSAAKEAQLDKIAQGIEGVAVQTDVLVGDPVAEVARLMSRHDHPMLVKEETAESVGVPGFSATDMRLLRAVPGAVAVARPEVEGVQVIVAAVDVSSDASAVNALNHAILDAAVLLLLGDTDYLRIVHFWRLYGESLLRSPRTEISPEEVTALKEEERRIRQERFDRLLTEYRARLDPDEEAVFDPIVELIEGDATTDLPAYVEEANASGLVIGTASRSGTQALLVGNTAETVLASVAASVLMVKPKDFVSPFAGD